MLDGGRFGAAAGFAAGFAGAGLVDMVLVEVLGMREGFGVHRLGFGLPLVALPPVTGRLSDPGCVQNFGHAGAWRAQDEAAIGGVDFDKRVGRAGGMFGKDRFHRLDGGHGLTIGTQIVISGGGGGCQSARRARSFGPPNSTIATSRANRSSTSTP